MAVSRRLRFEILRRDNHTCYYCGRKPPEVELTVDHVLPKALGGDDAATNLVAACTECNGGKTSIAPGSPLLAQVDEDAIRWVAAIQHAADKALAGIEAATVYRDEFYDAWHAYQRPAPLDDNWRSSIETFRSRGLPLPVLIDSAHQAMGKKHVPPPAKFAYTCGIAWNRLRDMEKDARAHLGTTAEAGESTADSDEVLIDALILLWRANWLASGDGEPGAALLSEARESAAAAHEENDDIEALVRGVISASWEKSADIKKDVYNEQTKEQHAVYSFFRGWLHRNGSSAERPPDNYLAELGGWVAVADRVEYTDDAIGQAAYWAARCGDISSFPQHFRSISGSIGDTSSPTWHAEFIEAGSFYRVSDQGIARMWEVALAEQEAFQRAQAERKARGSDNIPDFGA